MSFMGQLNCQCQSIKIPNFNTVGNGLGRNDEFT